MRFAKRLPFAKMRKKQSSQHIQCKVITSVSFCEKCYSLFTLSVMNNRTINLDKIS